MVSDYVLEFYPYNVAENLGEWTPVTFLSNNLGVPFATENTSASSSLNLVINRILPIRSLLPNNDTFFLTQQTRLENSSFYLSAYKITALACRDQFRLEIQPSSHNANDGLLVNGALNDVRKSYGEYRDKQDPKGPIEGLESDWLLYFLSFYPSPMFNALDKLAGSVLQAQTTASNGIQRGPPEHITMRAEVTRWFGVSILEALHIPELWTSAGDNDFGFGIVPYPDAIWICDSTLRLSSDYTSLNMMGLIVLLVAAIFIIIVSYFLQPILWFILRQRRNNYPVRDE